MTRPLRVTFVVPDLGVGGAERHVIDLLTHLDRSLVEPRVVCLGAPGRLFRLARSVAPASAYGHGKRQVALSVLRLARDLRRSRADVVVARGYSAELVGRVAAVLARVPRSVVWVHNCDAPAPRGRVRALGDRLLDPVTDAYFGVARRQVRYLTDELGHPARKIRVIHNGVDVEQYGRPEDEAARDAVRAGLGLGPGDVAVGVLAALRPEKEHELLMRALRRVVEEAASARLVVVGDGERRAALEAAAAALGLEGRVHFAGYRTDVARVLAALDVFALTSSSVECFPLSLLEAMAAGLPAVCTDVGGVSEILVDGSTGFLVPALEEQPLAERLTTLVADPALRRTMGEAGRARVRDHFTLAATVRATERELGALAPGRARRPERAGDDAERPPVELAVVMDVTAVGGAEAVVLATCAAFDPARVRPRLVCLREEGPLAEDFRRAGVPVTALGRAGRFDLRTLPRLVRALRGADAVLVSHHHRASLVLGRVAGRLAGAPHALVAAHDMGLAGLGGRVLPRTTVATLRWAGALVLLAPSQGRYLHDEEGVGRRPWSRTLEVVVPNGIALPPVPPSGARDDARAGLGLPDDAFVVGIVARLSAQKAHHVLLEAFVGVRDAVPGARLVVVGEGGRRAELEALTRRLGLDEAVAFLGVRRDVAALLPAFDVLALSSVHEAAPLVVIEAMAAGVPVVATDCGALRDMVDVPSEGLLVPVGDRPRLTAALVRLALEPDERRRMGAAARRRAERDFDVARTARGYEDLLDGLRDPSGAGSPGPGTDRRVPVRRFDGSWGGDLWRSRSSEGVVGARSVTSRVGARVRRTAVRAAGPLRLAVLRGVSSRPALASRTAGWTWLWQPGWSRRHHEQYYSGRVDPYGFDSNPGERRKYEETIALLDGRRFARALEVGAAEGAFTEILAAHCDEVVATEVSEAAADRARVRLADVGSVSVERRTLPLDAPEGTFDLIVCSDVLYLWQPETLDRGLALFAERLRPGGVLLLVHYVGNYGFAMSAHEVHDRAVAAAPRLGLEVVRSQELEHRGPDDAGYRADVLTRPEAGR